jgi:hypothetical protein
MRQALALVFVSIVTLLSVFAFATAQEGDILFVDGKYFIHTNPLKPFLDKSPARVPKSDVTSSANWRGYVATWRVKDDRLILTDISILHAVTKSGQSGFSTEPRSVMADVFPSQKEVLAEWFTGHVIIPDGKLVNYVHMGYASTYEKYIILRVERGLVTRKSATDTAGFLRFRDTQFAVFKKTDEYRKVLAESVAEAREGEGLNAEQNEEFLREFYSERSIIFDESR